MERKRIIILINLRVTKYLFTKFFGLEIFQTQAKTQKGDAILLMK